MLDPGSEQMTGMATSTIDQANVEIIFTNALDFKSESNRLEYFVSERLAYAVERELSSLELPEGAVLIIEELQLNLGDASCETYQTLFESRLAVRLRDALQAYVKKIRSSAVSRIDIERPLNTTPETETPIRVNSRSARGVSVDVETLKASEKIQPGPGAVSGETYLTPYELRLAVRLRDALQAHLKKIRPSAESGVNKIVDVEALKLFIAVVESGGEIPEQQIKALKQLLPAVLKRAPREFKKWLLSDVSRAGFESLHKHYSIAELELLVYTAAPELRYVLSQQGHSTRNTTEYKSVLLYLLAGQYGEVAQPAEVPQARDSEAIDLTVPEDFSAFIESPAEGSFSRAYSILERLFAISPQGFYQGRRTAVYAQLSNAKHLPEEVWNGVLEQYRQSVAGVGTKVLAGRLIQRAKLSELKSVCALLLKSRDDHLESALGRLAEETGRADLVWSLAIILIVRGDRVDIAQIRSLCRSLKTVFPDQTGKRFSWFLSQKFSESVSQPVPAERAASLESLLSALFTLSSTEQESLLRQQLIQRLSVPEQGKRLTNVLPAEFQVAVLQFVQGRNDWRIVNDSFLTVDQPSRLTSAKDTGQSWQHGVMAVDFELNPRESHLTELTQENPGSGSGLLTTAVTRPEQVLQKNQVSGESDSAIKANHSQNFSAHSKFTLAEASSSKQYANQLTDVHALARLIYYLPESKLAQIAEQQYGELFYRRHADIELISGVLNGLLGNTERANSADAKYRFCVGKAVKWSYLLGAAVQTDAGTSGTPVHDLNINEGADQGTVSSGGKDTLSGPDNSIDKALQNLIRAVMVQFIREVEQQSLRDKNTLVEQMYTIDNNRLQWGKQKIRLAIDAYSASRDTADNTFLDRLNSIGKIIEEFSEVPEPLIPELAAPVIEMAVNEEVLVDNAGVILAANLLPRLFEMLQLLEDNVFKSQADRRLGVQLLNFISYGEQSVGHIQPLSNVLCGDDVMLPLEPDNPLTTQQKESVNSMLQSIIDHWDIGNTSIEGLRASFICRDGVLQKLDQGWKLTVEPDAFDVLLDRLPWNYELVKLQWMEEPVHVTWR